MIAILQKPAYQLLIIQLLSIVAVLIYRPMDMNGLWTVLGLFYALFIVVNSIFLWPSPHAWTYFFISLGFSVIYMILAYLAGSGLSGILKLKGSGESSMIFLVIIYHPFTLLFIMLLKWVYGRIFS